MGTGCNANMCKQITQFGRGGCALCTDHVRRRARAGGGRAPKWYLGEVMYHIVSVITDGDASLSYADLPQSDVSEPQICLPVYSLPAVMSLPLPTIIHERRNPRLPPPPRCAAMNTLRELFGQRLNQSVSHARFRGYTTSILAGAHQFTIPTGEIQLCSCRLHYGSS
jgi:hypothetical protein